VKEKLDKVSCQAVTTQAMMRHKLDATQTTDIPARKPIKYALQQSPI
jgi:hypothetical protein